MILHYYKLHQVIRFIEVTDGEGEKGEKILSQPCPGDRFNHLLFVCCLFYEIIPHFPRVSLAGAVFCSSLSFSARLYWITPVAPMAHLSTVNDGKTSFPCAGRGRERAEQR